MVIGNEKVAAVVVVVADLDVAKSLGKAKREAEPADPTDPALETDRSSLGGMVLEPNGIIFTLVFAPPLFCLGFGRSWKEKRAPSIMDGRIVLNCELRIAQSLWISVASWY